MSIYFSHDKCFLNYLIANKFNLLTIKELKNTSSSMKLIKKTKIVNFLKVKDEISQLKNKKTKIVYILKVRDKMSQLKNKMTKIQELKW